MTSNQHLVLKETTLRPSDEWTPQGNGWLVARVAEGGGYWLHAGAACELNAGDGVVTGGGGLLRSSRLGPLKFQHFRVQPQYLTGLLSFGEWRQLEVVSAGLLRRPFFFSAGEPAGQIWVRIVDPARDQGMGLRCAMLQIWLAGVQDLFRVPVPEAAAGSKLNERIRKLIGNLTEAELANASEADLADQVNCCTRQFSRLFRKEFGITFHSRQIELRLQRAQQLLEDSSTKVKHIAQASGYRNLGLFNAMFKKRFGVTPSQWRRQKA